MRHKTEKQKIKMKRNPKSVIASILIPDTKNFDT